MRIYRQTLPLSSEFEISQQQNGVAREEGFEKAKIELIEEEYDKLLRVLAASGHGGQV